MNVTMQLAVVVAVCLCLAEGAPDGRLARKQQRPTRGFKNVEMMTARGFGKRDRPHPRAERDVHQQSSERLSRSTPRYNEPSNMRTGRGFGKRSTSEGNEESYNFEAPTHKKFRPKTSLLVAQDFGKRNVNEDISDEEEEIRVTRGTFMPDSNILIARGYGKRTDDANGVLDTEDFLEILGSAPEKETQEIADDKTVESIPVELFVMEMLNHPEFTRSVVNKFIDTNQDGMLSLEELLRNTA